MKLAVSSSVLGRGSWIVLAGVVVGASTLAVVVTRSEGRSASDDDVVCGLHAAPPAAAEEAEEAAAVPMSMEPPGGPILWGFAHAPGIPLPLDGQTHVIGHGSPSGTLLRFAVVEGCAGDLEIVRTSPAPRLVTRRGLAPVMPAYVPNGTYELSVTCDGAVRTSRLEVATRARGSARQAR